MQLTTVAAGGGGGGGGLDCRVVVVVLVVRRFAGDARRGECCNEALSPKEANNNLLRSQEAGRSDGWKRCKQAGMVRGEKTAPQSSRKQDAT